MTALDGWSQLALLTLRDPKAAATQIMDWDIEPRSLWQLAAVVIICSSILSSISNFLFPVPEPFAFLFEQPFRLFLIMAFFFLTSFYILFWVGRSLGGTGNISDLLALLVWLQALQTVAQVVVLTTLVLFPFVTNFLELFIVAATVWVSLNFISEGLQLGSLMRAFVVCLVAFFPIVFVSALVGMFFGFGALGVSAHV